jgi:LPS-assembly protein
MDKMTKKNLPLFKYILISILLVMSNPMLGQETPLSLISDAISYDKISENLSATGNVKVIYKDTILSAEKISYDKKNNELSIIGDFTINDGQNVIISDNDAIINTKLRNGLIKGARAIINEKLQISAQSLNQEDVNYNIFNTVVASSCEICATNKTPFWQIRARKIIHDKERQKIFFENARLDLLGLPILYMPLLNIPEPGIERADGFLVPQFSTSDKIGFSTKLPYYVVLDDHKDLTLTPFVMSKKSIIFETEYRHYTKSGFFELTNAFSIKNNLNKGRLNGFIVANGNFTLGKEYELDFDIDLANTVDLKNGEKPFKNNFEYAAPEDDRLQNTLDITKTQSDSFFRLGNSFTQSFRYKDFDGDGLKEEELNVPMILPEIYFRKNYKKNIFGGKYELSVHSINLENISNEQYTRIGGKLDWKRSWKTSNGLKFDSLAQINANTYLTENDFYKNSMPLGMIEARYPLKKSSAKVSHMFEPIAQVIFAPDRLTGYLNTNQTTSDSTTVEFEETNLFSSNRFPGFDKIESGSRANIGGKYIFYEPNGWEFTTTAGRVFRQKNLHQFDASNSTGLDNLNSDYVGAFSISSPQKFKILTRLLLDVKMDASKHETKLNYSTDKYSTDIGYVWLDKQSILNLNNHQHEVNISTDYMINQNWKFGADWRQNINNHSPISGNFDVMFENDCAKLKFSLDLNYDEQDRIDRSLGMQIFLSGLGSGTNKKKFNNRCGS